MEQRKSAWGPRAGGVSHIAAASGTGSAKMTNGAPGVGAGMQTGPRPMRDGREPAGRGQTGAGRDMRVSDGRGPPRIGRGGPVTGGAGMHTGPSGYQEELYTTKLDVSNLSEEQRLKAERLAAEIEEDRKRGGGRRLDRPTRSWGEYEDDEPIFSPQVSNAMRIHT